MMHQSEILKLIDKIDQQFKYPPIGNEVELYKLVQVLKDLLEILLKDSWNGVD